MFATTERLILRAYVDSDGKHIEDMYGNERVQRTGSIEYVVPWGPAELKKKIEKLNDALMNIIIEVKEDRCGSLRWILRANNNMNSIWRAGDEEDRWAGRLALYKSNDKNRDLSMGIALVEKWWGQGFGTEIVQWVVMYGFEQLGAHRISLGVLGSNKRAIELYKRW
jgi:RimJ/RimL family protein N-acetyltransferase